MEANKDQILADFQSCTGIEDIGEAIMYLESTNWNLLEAVTSVMPSESQTLPSRRDPIPMDGVEARGTAMPESVIVGPKMPIPVIPIEDDMEEATRLLNFSVTYKENTVPLEVPESETVAAIKTALHMELGVPPCRQELVGWDQNPMRSQNGRITDDTLLSSLHLPQKSNLFLVSPGHANVMPNSDMSDFSSRLQVSYKLHIVDITNNKEYDLAFIGSKTVLEIKLDLRDVTNIPVRFQRWVGWPDSLQDENTKLASLDIPDRVIQLILSRKESEHKPKRQLVVDLASSESDNEFEDAAECFGIEDDAFHASSSRRVQPMMPDEVDDELTAVMIMEKEFENRYGTCHPSFQGRLAEALQSSCHKPAKERRPLAIYLHHDSSVLSNVFCTQLLCSETVVSYLALNFVTWAWDLTFESNKTFLYTILSQQLGIAAANAVRNLDLSTLPAVMVIAKVKSTPEVLTVIPGNVGLDDIMTRLIHAVEVFNSEIQSEIVEEQEREARENVKREQDAAYEESLLADRAKEEARRHEFEEKMKQEEREMMEKEKLENMRQHEEELKDAVRRSLAEQLPPEPASDCSEAVSHIRVRVPGGGAIGRSFLARTPLALLLTYLASQGYPARDYKVLACWPRIDLTTVEESKTLKELNLYPKETITIEER